MLIDGNDLQDHLGDDPSAWDTVRADSVTRMADATVRVFGGADRVDALDPVSPEWGLLVGVALAYASRLYRNPEAVLQKRMGADASVSFADSVSAASGLTKDERRAIRQALRVPDSASPYYASEWVS